MRFLRHPSVVVTMVYGLLRPFLLLWQTWILVSLIIDSPWTL